MLNIWQLSPPLLCNSRERCKPLPIHWVAGKICQSSTSIKNIPIDTINFNDKVPCHPYYSYKFASGCFLQCFSFLGQNICGVFVFFLIYVIKRIIFFLNTSMYFSIFHSVNIRFRNWKLNAVLFLCSIPMTWKPSSLSYALVSYSLCNVLNSTFHLISKLFKNVALAHLPLNLKRYHRFMVFRSHLEK